MRRLSRSHPFAINKMQMHVGKAPTLLWRVKHSFFYGTGGYLLPDFIAIARKILDFIGVIVL